jgi:ubiquinone/menaquinone biosynthesis C-methylase UbiE
VVGIEVARSASGQHTAAPIEWRTGDAGALPFENDIFDVVLCQ